MNDLVAFLTQRLDEDIALAKAALASDGKGLTAGPWYDPAGLTMATFRTFWTPKRILEDLEAKREIIGLHVDLYYPEDDGRPLLCGGYSEAYWDVLLRLAQPHADHPDFNPEWKLQD